MGKKGVLVLVIIEKQLCEHAHYYIHYSQVRLYP